MLADGFTLRSTLTERPLLDRDGRVGSLSINLAQDKSATRAERNPAWHSVMHGSCQPRRTPARGGAQFFFHVNPKEQNLAAHLPITCLAGVQVAGVIVHVEEEVDRVGCCPCSRCRASDAVVLPLALRSVGMGN